MAHAICKAWGEKAYRVELGRAHAPKLHTPPPLHRAQAINARPGAKMADLRPRTPKSLRQLALW